MPPGPKAGARCANPARRDLSGGPPARAVPTAIRALEIAPSTYWSAKSRPPSARSISDATLGPLLLALFVANYSVYGRRKLTKAAQRAGLDVGRDQVARLMAREGIRGASRARKRFTTRSDPAACEPLTCSNGTSPRPAPTAAGWPTSPTAPPGRGSSMWLSSSTCSPGASWRRVSNTLRTDLAVDALEMAIWTRGSDLDGLVHHSDCGVQYLAIRYTERLAVEGAVTSVGSRGDSYDNALAESINALYKAELITLRGPCAPSTTSS